MNKPVEQTCCLIMFCNSDNYILLETAVRCQTDH